ncbi:MAG: succinylglutamate desuccinylase/aspartoacylase family protein [Armatimonadota bacterium]|nr:succinylglutamate desuccinylase/aspartoacylase family protein [Armatimonadota bacterium]MDR7401887.1 succinylglutamate desuccinylase/aspartoacylase family protein [Armatimonadota bacterium]MDR7404532.1 succinylglutamate desuccinylase/aspartoacylase family protein [Armatimonadota bacterium]MDR7436898.1 succinylglutamate desuccinylase/aspartoacylase family protein [Armatimonadota bacterium]MDR7471562.1 succinylglutamate desuccinylase/aspartoacylase family protein [Armatimonadota bacterium]
MTVDLHGGEIALYVHEVAGARDGPTIGVLSTLHGNEWLSVEILRRLLHRVDPRMLAGRLLAVPVGNPTAFAHLTRNTPDESDSPDLNRIFPGQHTWISDLLAQAITRHVLMQVQYLIDLHLGPWGSSFYCVAWPKDLPDREQVRLAGVMAHAYGCPLIQHLPLLTRFPGPRSAVGYAAQRLGVVPLLVEIGGVGFAAALEERWTEENVTGIVSVLRALGMLDGEPLRLEQYLHYTRHVRVNPSVAGYLLPAVEPEVLGREVAAGQEAGRVVSPYTFEDLEVLRVPVRGAWVMVSRPYPVRPGYWTFGVADLEEPGAGWGPPRTL